MNKALLLRSLLSSILLTCVAAPAATLYWSADGTNQGGAGIWNTNTLRWGTSDAGPFDQVWTNAGDDDAIIGGAAAAGLVTNSVPINVRQVAVTVTGYTLGATAASANTPFMTFTNGGGVDVPSGMLLTMGVKIAGTNFIKTGLGRAALNNSLNTVSRFTVNGGLISCAADNRFGAAPGALVSDYLTLDGGGFRVDTTTAWNLSATRGVRLGPGGGTFNASSATITNTINPPITGPGSLTVWDTVGTVTSAGAVLVLRNTTNDYAGSTTVRQGVLRLGASQVIPDTSELILTGGDLELNGFDETVGNVIVNSSSSGITGSTNTLTATNYDIRISTTINAILGGNAHLHKTTSGSAVLNGLNTYTGNTTNTAGNISINGSGRFGNGAGILALEGGSLTLSASRSVANTLQNPVVMTADTTIQNSSAATSAVLFRQGGVWTTVGGTLTVKNTTSGAGGSFDVVLTNAFTFSRPIIIGATGDTLPAQLSSFNLPGTDQIFTAELSGYGSFRRSVSSGSGGRTIFVVDNTYSGGTVINAGTLLVNNPGPGSGTGPGSVTVGSGGSLAGTGIVAGVVFVNTSGTIASGNNLGSLTLQGGLNLSGGGTNAWELNAPKDDSNGTAGVDFDQLLLTGGELDLSGNSRLLLQFTGTATVPLSTDPFWQNNHSWTIAKLSGTALNTTNLPFALIVNSNFNAGVFSNYVAAGGNIVLTFTTNPPSAPVITGQPLDRSAKVGTNTTFTVVASGTDPLSYQWYFQSLGNPIGGATSSSYVRTNIQPADAGNYFVVVTNLLGTATSSNALLSVILPQATLLAPGVSGGQVTISWGAIAGGSYQVQYSTNLNSTNWLVLTNIIAAGTNVSVVDLPPANAPERYYRILNQ
jgi:autotransporter-associated beta strand protein